ncbi:MAG: DUF1127 domain-containing protein [Proteobacteria bacterium]|nr:DUF1127 domain-containing protein [Pseudomonadota bacterium]
MLIATNANPHDSARQALLAADRARLLGDGLRHVARAAVKGFRKAVQVVHERNARARIVDQLSALDDRMLSDIGLRRSDIRAAVAVRTSAAAKATTVQIDAVAQDNTPTARAA